MASSRELGIKAVREGRYAEAVTIFEAMVEANPEDTTAFLMLAKAQQFNGQIHEARAIYEQVLRETEAPELLQMAQSGLEALPETSEENPPEETFSEPEELELLYCPRCDELIPAENRENPEKPWCSCGWNKPILHRRLLLTDLQDYAAKISSILAIKTGTDLYTLDGSEMRIMHLSDQSSPVEPRLVLKAEKGLAFIVPEDLSLIMPQVHESAVFRERKQKNDLSLGKLFTWDEMVAKINEALGYDATTRPLLFTLDEVFAMYRVIPPDMLEQAVEESVNANITVGQAILELGLCSLREVLVGAIGGPRLFIPANHLSNQIGHLLLEQRTITKKQLREALLSQIKYLRPLGNILVENKALSSEEMRAALKDLKDVRIHLAETERIGELLIARRAITRTELIQALEEQKKKKRPLGKLMLALGFIKEEDALVDALHWQELKMVTRRQGKIRLGELLIEKCVIGKKELAAALVRQIEQPLPLGELLVQARACTPEQLIDGILLQEERIDAHVEALIQKEIKNRLAGRAEEKRKKTAHSEREKAIKEKDRAAALERERAESRRTFIKALFNWKSLAIAVFSLSLGFAGLKAVQTLFLHRPPLLSRMLQVDPEPAQDTVDIDEVIQGIESGKPAPLDSKMKPSSQNGMLLPVISADQAVPARSLGDPSLSSGALRQAVAKNSALIRERPGDPKPFIEMGNALYNQGKIEEAIKSYREAIDRDSNSAVAHQQVGVILEEQGKLREARSELQKASEIAPLNPAIQRDNGDVLQRLGEHGKAVEAFQQAIAADPGDSRSYTRLGISLREENDLEGAVSSFKHARSLDPKDPYSSYQLASTLAGNSQTEEAKKEYERASKLLDLSSQQSLKLGSLSSKKRNYRAMIFHFGEAIRSRGLCANAQINLGKLLLERKDFKNSVSCFNQAKEIYRRNAPLHQSLGEACLILKDEKRAKDEFNAAASIDPKLPKPFYYLGVLSQKEEKRDSALELYRRCLANAPEGALAQEVRKRISFLSNGK